MSRSIFFFDDAELHRTSGLHRTYGPVEKLGVMTLDGEPWDFIHEPSASFAGTIIERPGGGWWMYYSHYSYEEGIYFRLALAESDDGLTWNRVDLGPARAEGQPRNIITVKGLPPNENIIQPQVVPAPEGGWLMYFWLHGHERGVVRYVAAESDDGYAWRIVNLETPCLFHPSDYQVGPSGWAAGLTKAPAEERYADKRTYNHLAAKRLRSNDATYVYTMPDGAGYEMFTVWLIPNHEGTGRHIPHDNAPGVVRALQRRTSADGIAWSDPELIIWPDDDDAADMQFYYISRDMEEDWRIGFIGHYRCWDQTMAIEPAFSRDGRQWSRPLRGNWIPWGTVEDTDPVSMYAPNRFVDLEDGRRLLLYTGHSILHNSKLPEGVTEKRRAIMGAAVPRGRYLGLRTADRQAGWIETKPFIQTAEVITVDADIRGALRYELCNPFGMPLEGFHLAECDTVKGNDGRTALTWNGRTTKDYQYDAVMLRLEIDGGTVYSIGT